MTSLAAPLYVITGVLALAGLAKMRRPSPTATALRALKVPAPMMAARLLGLAEVALAASAVILGAAILWAGIAVVYAAFTFFMLWVLSGNQAVASCGCFGHEDTPPTPGHAAFNAGAAAVSALAAASPVRLNDFDGSVIEAVVAVGVIVTAIALAVATLTSLPRTLALARGATLPRPQEFTLRPSTSTSTSSQGTR